jgi:AbrB family looped-hinge helix DNA binding protein
VQITSKGQVTIPQKIRERLGLLPYTEVEFELVGDHARIRKAKLAPGEMGRRARMAIEALIGSADAGLSTEEIMELTRGEPSPRKRRK